MMIHISYLNHIVSLVSLLVAGSLLPAFKIGRDLLN